MAVGLAFAYQYGVAPALSPNGSAVSNVPRVGQYLIDCWNGGCDGFGNEDLQAECRGNSGALRASFSSSLFFFLAALGACCKPTANREAWFAKYVLWLFLACGTVFIPNEPLFTTIYVWIARVGSMLFLIMQQIILIELAYNWNESWVLRSEEAEMEELGSGKKWLGAILASCGLMFTGSLTVIVLLFVYFKGCPENEAFISITLIMSVIITAAQLFSEEGSLLASAVITAYATYLALTAVTKNPNGACNPALGGNDVLGITLGVGFTIMSLAWTGWSYTADKKLGTSGMRSSLISNDNEQHRERGPVQGVVVDNEEDVSVDHQQIEHASDVSTASLQTWKINVVLLLISCWFGMALTGWGSIETNGTAASPMLGRVSMWMIISTQWLVMFLYLWTLLAPKLFPDRDFS